MTIWLKVQPDLANIETALKTHLGTDAGAAQDLCDHLLFSPGKRIRPLLAVLSARMGGDESRSLTLAAAVEYLHTATLLHDDILDEARLRRGKTAAHHIWGKAFTILGGDFMLARAVALVAGLDSGQLMQKFTSFVEKIIAGEILEMSLKGRFDLDEDVYFEIIRGKTAFLFKAACESGAELGGMQPQQIVVLGEYGLNLGLAFQIEDDIIDYLGNANEGKLKGNDLREGKATLPLILALQKADATTRKTIENIFTGESVSATQFNEACNFISAYGGFADARARAQAYVKAAVAALAALPASEAKTIMTELANSIISAGANRN